VDFREIQSYCRQAQVSQGLLFAFDCPSKSNSINLWRE
jgi:hypothetical protein